MAVVLRYFSLCVNMLMVPLFVFSALRVVSAPSLRHGRVYAVEKHVMIVNVFWGLCVLADEDNELKNTWPPQL